ncbi:uncharacterized protein PV07_10115 [Cladophialophora immunda]|uniref:6-methylsalicylate decarboxylase n=1 Tax=Cladophialophora immunda TaxID=569365 RepID=A0A0D2AHM3_9EURO|nr:uncharacterized protein PV07_10115 [Cladophialophora immunda]KIW24397.1 hypothetical protein PV07_10115 [Cladophialophora immunda]OQU97975.1 hypothetical protein CLAIMM_03823 isoform 1 [Cladophialophora immunda]OQU97976.1 hypothetical protein CLAIMM_03823 isoform 2 [Cladophialophora immunda]
MMIDTHHHFVPDFYAKAVEEAGGDPSGWHVPSWSTEASEASLAQNQATTAILSLTAPGAAIAPSTEGSRALARRANEFCAQVRDAQPAAFGFFAALPDLLDTEGALAEVAHALDTLGADGVTLFTRYGPGPCYLGHREFDAVWAALDARAATVFVHPTHPVDTRRAHPALLQPSVDYPHETTRAAMDLLLAGNRRRFPRCKVILSHAGGTLPWLLPRTIYSRRGLAAEQIPDGVTYEQMMADFRSFYFDLALSTSHRGLDLLLAAVPHDHITYGSDFPYAPSTSISNFRADLESYPMDKELREKIYFRNALALLPRLRQYFE